MTKELCECCERHEVMWVLKDVYGDKNERAKEYKVCANCLSYLTTYSLKPEMFFNLLRNGHTVREFLLHEDFYDDETGEALQPVCG